MEKIIHRARHSNLDHHRSIDHLQQTNKSLKEKKFPSENIHQIIMTSK
jgi:hypothetical protein